MNDFFERTSRREFLGSVGAAAGMLLTSAALAQKSPQRQKRRPRVAALFTEFRFRSHAYNILENFFAPYLFRGELTDPGVEVVSFFADQFPANDMAREVSKRFKIPLYATIDEALCQGGKQLEVDAVLLIGEHGDYPFNERGQKMYPRKEFFDQSVAVMKRSGRFVPLFNDKHLSYRFDWARQMYDTSREHGFPLMAGSSVPLAERKPELELPEGAELEEAVSIHGGGLEVYDFHGLEVLQSFVEARRGGESGIASVELLTGEALEQARRAGRWSAALESAAMAAEEGLAELRQARPDAVPGSSNDLRLDDKRLHHALLVTYLDGFRASVLKVGNNSNRWNFACKVKDDPRPRATAIFNSPWGNRGLFKALSHAIQYLFIEGREPYPVERTLLVSGALDAAMVSHEQGGRPVETPQLKLPYRPIDFRQQRENGATWKIITRQTLQPTSFEPGDRKFVAG